jgi:hypothetical protein
MIIKIKFFIIINWVIIQAIIMIFILFIIVQFIQFVSYIHSLVLVHYLAFIFEDHNQISYLIILFND